VNRSDIKIGMPVSFRDRDLTPVAGVISFWDGSSRVCVKGVKNGSDRHFYPHTFEIKPLAEGRS
jgi:hypothetical protein